MAPPLPYTIRRRRAVGLALVVVGLLAWGGRNERHRKIERGGGGFLALGGRRFKCLNNNQMGDGDDVRGCVGEEARLGRNVLGGRLPVVWGVELIDQFHPWFAYCKSF
jgi:hypothetical protein